MVILSFAITLDNLSSKNSGAKIAFFNEQNMHFYLFFWSFGGMEKNFFNCCDLKKKVSLQLVKVDVEFEEWM